jgi:type IV pilus biogenesis protein CpaD/CtpE
MKLIKKLVNGVLILFLIAFLSSCAAKPVTTPCYPPTIYLQEIPEPSLLGKTNHDLIIYLLDLKEAVRLSNSDKRTLQEWADSF